MTGEDAHLVGLIVMDAHGQCFVCAAKLIDKLMRTFPERRADFLSAWLTGHDEAMLQEGIETSG